jgi:hypothetical protein
MPIPACVLLFGKDAHLQESRRLVLESIGCKVYVGTRLLALNQILANFPIDFLILCHTLSEEECEQVKSIIQSRWPTVKVVVLAANTFDQCSESGDRVVSTGDGPKALVDCIAQMTKKIPPRPNGSEASA